MFIKKFKLFITNIFPYKRNLSYDKNYVIICGEKICSIECSYI